MIPRIPEDPVRRAQRKADLLMASQLLRGQAVLAVDDLGGRADHWGRRWLWLQAQLADPWVRTAGALGAAFMAGSGRRRGRWMQALRWGLLAWRVWRRKP